jgi:pyruvate kinase
MLDTVGPELQVKNPTGEPIVLEAGNHVTITADSSKAISAEIFPLNFGGLAKVKINIPDIPAISAYL